MWPLAPRYTELFTFWGARFGVPVWVLQATAAKESSFNSDADAGAGDGLGLMGMTIWTARGLGFDGTRDQLRNPSLNVQLGAKLIAQLRRRYPAEPWDHIYSAYRAGQDRHTAASSSPRDDVFEPGDMLLAKDERYVVGWRRAADFFRSGWRNEPPDFPPAGSRPASPPSWPLSLCSTGCGNNNGGLIVQIQGIPTFAFKYVETGAKRPDASDAASAESAWQVELTVLGAAGWRVVCSVGTVIVCERMSGAVPLPGSGIVGAPS